ncbi:MAG: hypothetical protein ACRD6R_06060, partial [Candidatus Polarisedimenticolia bacterium]
AAPPAAVEPPSGEVLREIETRGRFIATCWEAVAEARDQVRTVPLELPEPDGSVALQERDGGWRVVLLLEGTGVDARKGPRILAEVAFDPTAGAAGPVRSMNPPRPAPASITAHLRAQQQAATAVAGLPGGRGPFDAAVTREKDGRFGVYLKGRAPEAGMVPFGGDFLVRVAASGRRTESIEALHAEAAVVARGARAPGEPTLHVHAGADLPPPTDVAEVLRSPDLAPHLILTPRWMFRVDDRGGLTWLGPNRSAPSGP